MRSQWIDATRGIAIVLVVIGHSIQFGSHYAFDIFTNPAFVAIYAFHMPLFIFISGYLAYSGFQRRRELPIVTDRVSRLLVPIVSWAILAALLVTLPLQLLRQTFTFSSLLQSLGSSLIPGNTLWFLWVLFLAYVVLAAAHWASHLIGIVAFPLSIVVLFLLPFDTGFAFYQLKWLYPFFIAGYALRLYRDRLRRFEYWAVAIATVAFIVMLAFWEYTDSVYVARMTVLDGGLKATAVSWAYRYAIGLAGIIMTMGIIRLLSRRFRLTALAALGVASLGIYCIQTYLMVAPPLLPSPAQTPLLYFGLYVPLLAAVVLTISYFATTRILERIKPLRILLLGGR